MSISDGINPGYEGPNGIDVVVSFDDLSLDIEPVIDYFDEGFQSTILFGEPIYVQPVSPNSLDVSSNISSVAIRHSISVSSIDASAQLDGFASQITELFSVPDHDLGIFNPQLSASEKFSGVVLNQNQTPTGQFSLDNYSSEYDVYQEFTLPRNYARGDSSERIPPLTGLQLCVSISEGFKNTSTIDYIVEFNRIGFGWVELTSGTSIGSHIDGDKVWFDVYFDSPVDVLEEWINGRFRFGIRGRSNSQGTIHQEISYENGQANIDGEIIDIDLTPGQLTHYIYNDVPITLYIPFDSDIAYYSVQQGINHIWLTTPNPLATTSSTAYDSNGNIIKIGEENAAVLFRILGGIAEEGTDFLGNQYRSVISGSSISNIDLTTQATKSNYWMSKPNPSKFAVESLYFDMRDSLDKETTIDRLFLDPITTGVYFNVYYSSNGEPGTNESEWENRVWKRVPKTYRADKDDTYAFPEPITAKYIKIEFTHLQAREYDPGEFAKPITYKKYPKWVLDYFLLRLATEQTPTEDIAIGRRVSVSNDALDLAYNYYLDDLKQEPLTPAEIGNQNINDLNQFLSTRNDSSDRLDSTTLSQINTEFQPYRFHPTLQSDLSYLPSTWAIDTYRRTDISGKDITPDYSTERLFDFKGNLEQVSSLDRDAVIFEKSAPIMYFFVDSRHLYRIVTAPLSHNRAYFVGINSISFMRDSYPSNYDTDLYVESAGDTTNMQRQDLVLRDGNYTTY